MQVRSRNRGLKGVSFRPVVALVVTIVVFSLPPGCAGKPVKMYDRPARAGEFQPFDPGYLDIIFLAQEFGGTPVKAYAREIPRVAFEEIAVFDASGYHARIFLGQAKKNVEVRLRARETPRESLSAWSTFRDKEVRWGNAGEASTPFGDVDWQTFEFELQNCVTFYRAFAPTPTSRGPTKRMRGFFCNRPGETLTAKSIQDLFQQLGVRDYAEPEPR